MSKQLNSNEKTAQKAVVIMGAYKEGVKNVMSDKSLTSQQQREKIDLLITEKNIKLQKILSAEQLQKIVPTTELQGAKL